MPKSGNMWGLLLKVDTRADNHSLRLTVDLFWASIHCSIQSSGVFIVLKNQIKHNLL